MVYISRAQDQKVPRLNAYLTTALSAEELAKFKKSFELGACSSFTPLLELVIKDEASYHNKSHADILRAEDAAGRAGKPFILIDERSTSDDAIWYVQGFATEDQVEDGIAESTDVVLEILTKTNCVALMYVNYDIAKADIMEDLESCCGVDFPIGEEFEQESIYDIGGMDMAEQQRYQRVGITAEPGEFDESTDEELRKKFKPQPGKVAKLKENLAKVNGLLADWTIVSMARTGPMKLPDGTEKTFPEGSVVLQHKYDTDFPWPEYQWPEGSL